MKLSALVSTLALGGIICLGCIAVGPVSELVAGKEVALIVWDPAAKVEHFIRSAEFDTSVKSFGFIVPTPSVPKVEVVGSKFFTRLAKYTDRVTPAPTSNREGVKAASVEVVQRVQVGGYDSATLKGDNTKALDAWFGDHGFKRDQRFSEWAKPYVDRGWYFTAFRLLSDDGTAKLEPIHLTFDTLEPFFPYREPPDPVHAGSRRDFDLYFLSAKAYKPVISRKPWEVEAITIPEINGVQRYLETDLRLPAGTLDGYHGAFYMDHSQSRNGKDDIVFIQEPESAQQVPRNSAFVLAGILVALALSFVGYRVFRH